MGSHSDTDDSEQYISYDGHLVSADNVKVGEGLAPAVGFIQNFSSEESSYISSLFCPGVVCYYRFEDLQMMHNLSDGGSSIHKHYSTARRSSYISMS